MLNCVVRNAEIHISYTVLSVFLMKIFKNVKSRDNKKKGDIIFAI